MQGGGRDRADLQGFDPRKYEADDDPNKLMGAHKGKFLGLNVQGAEPGRHYFWARNDATSQMQSRMRGYTTVDATTGASAAHASDPASQHQPIDSSNIGYPGIVLMSRSTADERRERDEQAIKRGQLMRSGDQGYLNGASGAEINAGGKRLQRDDHRSYVAEGPDEGAAVIQSWKPDATG